MRIEAMETSAYRVPLARPWGDQTHRITHLELVVARIIGDGGQAGTGFSYSVGVGAMAAKALLDWDIAPRLRGSEVAPAALWHRLWREVHDAGGGGVTTLALAACDIGVWDLLARDQGRPLTDVLGRCRPSIAAYGSGVNLNLDAEALGEQIRSWIDRGYPSVKIKVGKPDPGEDLERLAMVRSLIGTSRGLMVDANQGWDRAHAVRAIRSYTPFDLLWVEEPLLSDDVESHAWLRRQVQAPIALGENVYTGYQFNDYLARGACDIVQADVVRVGGITPWLEIASLAATWGVSMAPHFLLELSGQLLCCVPNAEVVEDVDGGSFSELGILTEPIAVREGVFVPPSRPGHGIDFDPERLAPHRVADEPPRAHPGTVA